MRYKLNPFYNNRNEVSTSECDWWRRVFRWKAWKVFTGETFLCRLKARHASEKSSEYSSRRHVLHVCALIVINAFLKLELKCLDKSEYEKNVCWKVIRETDTCWFFHIDKISKSISVIDRVVTVVNIYTLGFLMYLK